MNYNFMGFALSASSFTTGAGAFSFTCLINESLITRLCFSVGVWPSGEKTIRDMDRFVVSSIKEPEQDHIQG